MIKRISLRFLLILFTLTALSACGETSEAETETIPDVLIEDVQSILAENGFPTVRNGKYFYSGGAVYHGGMQTRVCRTERGVYTAFAKSFLEGDYVQPFYVAKLDHENNVSLLYYGEFPADDNEVCINLAQDTNGDIWVTTTSIDYDLSAPYLAAYKFDHETDAVTKYERTDAVFSSNQGPSYTTPFFDFENRKIYSFHYAIQENGGYLLEWFTFDMETGVWSPDSVYTVMNIGRHNYSYHFPDGNGGMYYFALRGMFITDPLVEALKIHGDHRIVTDQLTLFHIPDLTSSDNITYTIIQEPYSERGDEGIWSVAQHNTGGDAFMDANGYLHLNYLYYKFATTDAHPDLDPDVQYRHAIFDGMECIFNEELTFQDPDNLNYKPCLMQSTDGTLYMIVAKQHTKPISLEIYRAGDALGKTWSLVKEYTLQDGLHTSGFSISCVRDGSIQDDIVTCFMYGYYQDEKMPYIFDLSLTDYSITEPVGIFEGFALRFDDWFNNRTYNSGHQTKIVRTETGTYAAFVYNFNGYLAEEYFHIVKIGDDGNSDLLYSGSYSSMQDKYLTMQRLPDGRISVTPPTGNILYTVDPTTDKVEEHEIGPYVKGYAKLQQADFVVHPETGSVHLNYIYSPFVSSVTALPLDPDTTAFPDDTYQKYYTNRKTDGTFGKAYTLSDGKGGTYIVATQKTACADLADRLTYMGHTKEIEDTITLFHIPSSSDEKTMHFADVVLPYEAEGDKGIWSVINVADNGDVFLDSAGKLHILYTYYLFDYDDADRRENPALINETFKQYHAVYEGTNLVSLTEVEAEGLTYQSFLRMTETADGALYLLACTPRDSGTRLEVYREDGIGWVLQEAKELGTFTAESFSVTAPRGGSVRDNTVGCLLYAMDNDVYYTTVSFE